MFHIEGMRTLFIFYTFLISFNALATEFVSGEQTLLYGYDPVSYITEDKAQKGSNAVKANHEGVDVYFSSKKNKELFLKNPEKYIPAYNGWCAYAMAENGKLVDVDPKTFKVINGKTYLFYNGFWGNTLKKWNKKTDSKQIESANGHWKNKH